MQPPFVERIEDPTSERLVLRIANTNIQREFTRLELVASFRQVAEQLLLAAALLVDRYELRDVL